MRRLRFTDRKAFLGGFGLGSLFACVGAYYGDPRLGRRRRALAGDRVAHFARVGGKEIGRSERYVANHARGLFAYFRAKLRRESVPDEVVEQRVRAALGRVSRHVAALDVAVENGSVTLCGPILDHEHRQVLRTVRRVRGVRLVDDYLDRHLHPDIPALGAGGREARRSSVRRLSCAQIMKTNPRTAREDDSVRDIAELMAEANIGFLPVCDAQRRVVGTLTDRDIVVRAVASGWAPDAAQVGQIMSPNVVACRPDDDLLLAEQFMERYQVSRVVITDEQGVLKGVISLSDIAENEPSGRAARTLRGVAAREAPRPAH
jgi:CBS domain-containing protein